jgi:dTMP kinase
MAQGAFICIEGLDGSGKTTQAKILVEKLRKSRAAVYTAEPSRGQIGDFIRKSCLYSEKRLPTIIEALLFAADRVEHLSNEIVPALKEGKIVVSDRYLYSSLAYQGSSGLDLEWIERINIHALRPDLAVFIDVPPRTVMQRLKPEKSVMETLETQNRVREIYLQYVDKGELVRVDGGRRLADVSEALFARVSQFLGTFKPC